MENTLTAEQLEAIRRLDTCLVSNAIDTFNVRLRNEGFADASIRCMFPHFPPLLGYAVTARISCSGPPPAGHSYFDRTDWWSYIATIPAPRVTVIQDIDEIPGVGGFVGEVHANVLRALNCAGTVTNGGVRDLPAVEQMGYQLFAGNVSVSHAYVHMIDFGGPVEVGGLTVRPGDLILGDCHGVLAIPRQIAAEIPAVAARMVEKERRVIGLCRSPEFSLQKLRTIIKELG
ncbi:MAG TPA: RraA family protein [Bryobacterales bacterium]|nr:RraA family protein [Bryobacterales bacterium]